MFDQQPEIDEKTGLPTVFFVSQRCIDEGTISIDNCMVALSVKDFGGESPIVGKDGVVTFSWNGKRYIGKCDNLGDKVDTFDRGNKEDIKPFIFQLDRWTETQVEN